MDPLLMMQSAILRTTRSGVVLGPDQRVDALTALKAVTINVAWQYREEDTKGSIAPRKLADFVILDRDPITTPAEELLTIRRLETFKEGVSVWKAPA
jgi:predicted amidohydrolase YtcJ